MNPAPTAAGIAHAIRSRATTATAVIEATLQRIARDDPAVHAFTATTPHRARAEAAGIDARIAAGEDPGPLAGVPFAVKNLFDVRGVVTLAGSRILATNSPAARDATAIARLGAAGAIMVGTLNMEEFAYGFFTDNAHYGRTVNPHDGARTAGGSSGGSGAAVAAGLVPIALGSDTNGSIRVPAAFCGTVGLKPTYGRLSRAGIMPFVPSFDHIGPLGGSVADVAMAYDAMQGPDPLDPVHCGRLPEPAMPTLHAGLGTLRLAIADGYFAEGMTPGIAEAVAHAAAALGVVRRVGIPAADAARAAAYVITSAEGTELQRENLRRRPQDFDPATRDRFLAGAFIPAAWYVRAQRMRTWFRAAMADVFQTVDVIIAPVTTMHAPRFDAETIDIEGQPTPVRPSIGRFTQPLSLIGLPILAVPVHRPNQLPTAVQLIGAPYTEALLLRVGQVLEARLQRDG